MKAVRVVVLSATEDTLSMELFSESSIGVVDNTQLLCSCSQNGSLRELLSGDYADLSSFLEELSLRKVETALTLLDASLPTVRWQLLEKKPCLEMLGEGSASAVFSIRVKTSG